MKIAFRADASIQIGTGHIMRCLTLADALRERGAKCTFVCRPHHGHLAERIRSTEHEMRMLPPIATDRSSTARDLYANWLGCSQEQDAAHTIQALDEHYDWLIVDHYGLDAAWERELQPKADRMLVIDDLANRPHVCDVLLDQNLGRKATDYADLVGSTAQCLIGPQYALLRSDFAQLREYSLARRRKPKLKHILVNMGGIDKNNITGRILETLRHCDLLSSCRITVVMGRNAPALAIVQKQAQTFPEGTCEVLVDTKNMAKLMADSDLAIGAAGSTSWERCCLGLPTIIFVLAENQKHIADALNTAGAAIVREMDDRHTLGCLGNVISNFCLRALADISSQVTDGQGTSRLIRILECKHAN